MTSKPLTLAYFLPQFHECEYNNKWWGKGFTEWVNVKIAKPLKDNHYQPRIPADGYYDLLDEGEIEKQFKLARDHGIDGFAIYHYWYEGDKPLGKPVDKILDNPDIDVNFSLCWANHSWTRSWKNRLGSTDVLIEQSYGRDKTARMQHYDYLIRAFSDPRYIKVDGKPLFQIYIPEAVTDLQTYVSELRQATRDQMNSEIHISATIRNKQSSYNYLSCFDSLTLANPTLSLFSDSNVFGPIDETKSLGKSLRKYILTAPLWLKKIIYRFEDMLPKSPTYFDYDTTWNMLIKQTKMAIENAPMPINISGFTEFDNTPRYRENAKVLEGFTPDKFQNYMAQLANLACDHPHRILFINAWNEWGEGMHLEGDKLYPTERLEALKAALTFNA